MYPFRVFDSVVRCDSSTEQWTTSKKWQHLRRFCYNNFHLSLLTENQRWANVYTTCWANVSTTCWANVCTTCWANVCTTCWANVFLDEQSADGFASRNQRWPNENCSLRLNVGPTKNFHLLSGIGARSRYFLIFLDFFEALNIFFNVSSTREETILMP